MNSAVMPVGEGKIPLHISRRAAQQTQGLTVLEAANVYAVLKSCMEKLGLVGSIVVDPKLQAQELTQSVGEEITRMIAEQKELETRFQQLITAQQMLRNLPNKSKFRENQAELQRVAEALRTSTKTLCRNLKDNPNVSENMAKVASERQSLQLLLSNCLDSLASKRHVQPVVETVMTLDTFEVEMRDTIENERNATTAVKQLRNDIKDEKGDHEEQMRTKTKNLISMKEQLKEVKLKTAVDLRYHTKDRAATNESLSNTENIELDDLQKELNMLRQQIELEQQVHDTTAEFMRKLQSKLQDENSDWARKHDQDSQDLQNKLELVHQNTVRDTQRLKDMEERHAYEQRGRLARESDRQEEELAREEGANQLVRQVYAATRIQAAWRGYRVRKAAKASKGKKGGKKGGKKKK